MRDDPKAVDDDADRSTVTRPTTTPATGDPELPQGIVVHAESLSMDTSSTSALPPMYATRDDVAAESRLPEPPIAEPVAYEPPIAEAVAYEPPIAKPVEDEPPIAKLVEDEPPIAKPVADEPPIAEPVADDPAPAAPAGWWRRRRQSQGNARLSGIDLARALAMIGMLAVHVGPFYPVPTTAGQIYALSQGRASVLFMLVAGVGVALLAGSRSTSRLQVNGRLAWRAALLLPLGLWLQTLDHWVLVILPQYATMFLLAILVLGLRDRWLLILSASSALLGTLGFLAGRIYRPDLFDRASIVWGDSAGDIVHGLLLSGPYPVVVWAAPFLLGIWIGRRNLRAWSTQLALLLVGALATAAAVWLSGTLQAALADIPGWQRSTLDLGSSLQPLHFFLDLAPEWRQFVIDDPHSQMPLWILGSMGSASMVLGFALLVARALGGLLWPLVAMGQITLTVYVAHLLVLHQWRPTFSSDDVGQASLIVLGFTVVACLFAVLWRALLPRGPLETLFLPPWEWRSNRRRAQLSDTPH